MKKPEIRQFLSRAAAAASMTFGCLLLLRMLPVEELFQGAFVVLLAGSGLLLLLLRPGGNWSALGIVTGMFFGVLIGWDATTYLLKRRLLHCAAAAVEKKASNPILVCPGMQVRGPNLYGVTFVHFEGVGLGNWLWYAVFIPDASALGCRRRPATRVAGGQVCLDHR